MGNATRMLLFIVISSVILSPLIAPFFKPGRAWTYDVDIHAFRMAAFHNALKDGNIPPRWSSQLVYGWGSPLFSFNWSLPYWMGEPFLFAGWSVTDASKAVIILSVVLSYLFMFFFLREWFGFWPAMGGTAIYEWSLYRLFLLFTGGGLGMHAAFIFWPMLFWGVLTGKKNPTRAFILICLGTAGLMLSHQVMFLMIQPLLWVFILFTVRKDMNTLTRLGGAFFAGLGLTAYFWLPAFVEQNFLHIGMTKLIVWNNFLYRSIPYGPCVRIFVVSNTAACRFSIPGSFSVIVTVLREYLRRICDFPVPKSFMGRLYRSRCRNYCG